MPKKRKNIFTICKECLELVKIANTNDFDAYMQKFSIDKNRPDIAYINENFQEWQQSIDQRARRCPFKLILPNLPIREYNLKCFHCNTKFNCPAEVYRNGNEKICGECEIDTHNDDRDYPEMTEEDEMKEIQRHLVDKYGEC